jgi:hypothetical protein
MLYLAMKFAISDEEPSEKMTPIKSETTLEASDP